MFRVKDFMTKDPITVDPAEKISAVIDLMKFHHIHRIPVVDARDHLVGLITEGMIAADNTATSLSIYELNYLLSKTEVRAVMVKHPVYVNENDLMEQATEKLLKNDIGCLPVVSDEGKVVGILTQNDIFKAFLEMLGWSSKGSRILLIAEERVGVLEKLSSLFASQNISIRNISVYGYTDDQAKILIRTVQPVSGEFIERLKEAGYRIVEWE